MANFDFKAATPATLTTAGFLFGATSQGAATPSIFTTTFTGTGALVCGTSPSLTTPAIGVATATSLAVGGATIGSDALGVTGTSTLSRKLTITQGTANESILASTGFSLTGSNTTAIVDIAATYNTSGIAAGFRINVTNTASDFRSRAFEVQLAGVTKACINPAGNVYAIGGYNIGGDGSPNSPGSLISEVTSNILQFQVGNGGSGKAIILTNNAVPDLRLGSAHAFGWSSAAGPSGAVADLIMVRAAAASLQLGAADAASTVAQTLQVQSVVAGTADTAGGNWTLKASKSTGAGVPGDIIFQTSGKGAASTTQNTLITALTIKGGTTNNTNVGQPSIVIGNAAIATNATDGFLYIPTCAGTPTGTPTTFTGRVALVYDTTNHQFWIFDGSWLQPKTPAAAAVVTWQ